MSHLARTRAELRYTGTWWYSGTEADWRSLPEATRNHLSLQHTGCLYAFPSWRERADDYCLHTDCRIARGELPAIAKVNSQLRAEAESGWLRFIEDRAKLARIFRAHRRIARLTGRYDIWSAEAWQLTVHGGIQA